MYYLFVITLYNKWPKKRNRASWDAAAKPRDKYFDSKITGTRLFLQLQARHGSAVGLCPASWSGGVRIPGWDTHLWFVILDICLCLFPFFRNWRDIYFPSLLAWEYTTSCGLAFLDFRSGCKSAGFVILNLTDRGTGRFSVIRMRRTYIWGLGPSAFKCTKVTASVYSLLPSLEYGCKALSFWNEAKRRRASFWYMLA